MDMDAAPALKRKGADASELWLHDDGPGFPAAFRAAKSRRLDADVLPPVVPGAVVPPPQPVPVEGFGVVEEEAPMCGDVAGVKRKSADAPELWLDEDGGGGDGFPVAFHATKSRRLDADVPPVVPGAVVPLLPQTQPVPMPGFGVQEVAPMCGDVAVVPVDVTAPALGNEERAIVLYRPAEAVQSLLQGPLRPGAPLRVNPDWIHGLKGTVLQGTNNNRTLFPGEETSNLAMVPWAPWAPSRVQAASTATEMMDADDSEGASMDVEQDRAGQLAATHHQWPPQQQQHCIVQQPIPAASYQPSPVTWSW